MYVRRSELRFFMVAAVSAFSLGCQYNPHAHLETTEKPHASDVVGTYVLARQTVFGSDAAGLGGRRCALILRGDGTFEAEGIPSWDMYSTGRGVFGKLVSGAGTWRIHIIGTVDNGWQMKDVWGIYLESPDVKLKSPALSGSKAPYGLIFTLGDPDAGEALFLHRVD